jgi:hypothetical protein
VSVTAVIGSGCVALCMEAVHGLLTMIHSGRLRIADRAYSICNDSEGLQVLTICGVSYPLSSHLLCRLCGCPRLLLLRPQAKRAVPSPVHDERLCPHLGTWGKASNCCASSTCVIS